MYMQLLIQFVIYLDLKGYFQTKMASIILSERVEMELDP